MAQPSFDRTQSLGHCHQTRETERGGIAIYKKAIRCAVNADLKKGWTEYLEETKTHTTGWTRELWIEALGMPAALPPPEGFRQVETAIGASRAEQARSDMFKQRD